MFRIFIIVYMFILYKGAMHTKKEKKKKKNTNLCVCLAFPHNTADKHMCLRTIRTRQVKLCILKYNLHIIILLNPSAISKVK